MKRLVGVSLSLVALWGNGACRRVLPPTADELAAMNEVTWEAEEARDRWTEGFLDPLPARDPEVPLTAWEAAWFGGYDERLCQLTGSDWLGAVFLVQREDGTFRAVARSYEGVNDDGYLEGTEAEALRDGPVRPEDAIQTAVLDLDGSMGRTLADACRAALSRRSTYPSGGADGEFFYAEHWARRRPRAGAVWSPETKSVARGYVDLARMLWKFVRVSPQTRAGMQPELVARARALTRQVRETR